MLHRHNWGKWGLMTPSIQVRHCGKCGLMEQVNVPHVHDWPEWQNNVWVIDGKPSKVVSSQQRKCTTCGEVEKRELPHTHEWGPYGTVDGTKSYKNGVTIEVTWQYRQCRTCGYKLTRSL